MDDKALARPLLLTKGVNFTRLAVDRVNGLDQRAYNMLFIGTGTNASRLLQKKTNILFVLSDSGFFIQVMALRSAKIQLFTVQTLDISVAFIIHTLTNTRIAFISYVSADSSAAFNTSAHFSSFSRQHFQCLVRGASHQAAAAFIVYSSAAFRAKT